MQIVDYCHPYNKERRKSLWIDSLGTVYSNHFLHLHNNISLRECNILETSLYIYIYIYIYRERERERKREEEEEATELAAKYMQNKKMCF